MGQDKVIEADGVIQAMAGSFQSIPAPFHGLAEVRQEIRVRLPQFKFKVPRRLQAQNARAHSSRQGADTCTGVEDANRASRDVQEHPRHELGDGRWRAKVPSLFSFGERCCCIEALLLVSSELRQGVLCFFGVGHAGRGRCLRDAVVRQGSG